MAFTPAKALLPAGLCAAAFLGAGARASADEPSLSLTMSPVVDGVQPGQTVMLVSRVRAVDGEVTGIHVTKMSVSTDQAELAGECATPFTAKACLIGTLAADESDILLTNLTLPKTPGKKVTVRVGMTLAAANAADVSATTTVTYSAPRVPPRVSPRPTRPAPTREPPPKKGKRPARDLPTPSLPTFPVRKNPAPALPTIAAPTPSTAGAPPTEFPVTRLRGEAAPPTENSAFDRIVWIHTAWLTALLFAITTFANRTRSLWRSRRTPRA